MLNFSGFIIRSNSKDRKIISFLSYISSNYTLVCHFFWQKDVMIFDSRPALFPFYCIQCQVVSPYSNNSFKISTAMLFFPATHINNLYSPILYFSNVINYASFTVQFLSAHEMLLHIPHYMLP